MAAAPLIIAAAGTALSAYGMYRQGQVAKRAGQFNAEIAERDAEMAAQKADFEAKRSAEEYAILRGKQRVAYAKGGVDPSKGSPLLMLAWQAEQEKADEEAIRYGGETARQSALSRGAMSRYEGREAGRAGTLSAGSTFLTQAADTGMKWRNYKKTGTWG